MLLAKLNPEISFIKVCVALTIPSEEPWIRDITFLNCVLGKQIYQSKANASIIKQHINLPIYFLVPTSIQWFQWCILLWSICYFTAMNFKYPKRENVLQLLFWSELPKYHMQIGLSFQCGTVPKFPWSILWQLNLLSGFLQEICNCSILVRVKDQFFLLFQFWTHPDTL